MAGPRVPAPPRPPGLPADLAAGVDLWALDELYADVDGVDVAGVDLELPEARTLDLLRSRLRACRVAVPAGCAIELRDCEVADVDLSGRRLAGLVRTRLVGCRLTGADLSEATVEDVLLEDCALDLASWRRARVERVAVRGGRLDGLDATGATLRDLEVSGTALEGVALDGARCERVDLTAADLTAVRRVADLAGATISATQAVLLAARLAHGLGIEVRRDDGAFPA